MTNFIRYLKIKDIPEGEDRSGKITNLLNDELFKRGYSQPLLKCVTLDQVEYIIRKIHESIYGYHSRARTMTTWVLRVGYF